MNMQEWLQKLTEYLSDAEIDANCEYLLALYRQGVTYRQAASKILFTED